MSPLRCGYRIGSDGFPRVSGDEPVSGVTGVSGAVFSPRERG